MKSKKLVSITKTALMVAVIAVLSQIAIPIGGVPLTLQTFAIAFCGYFLGIKLGLTAVSVYLLAGAIGLPVFAGFGATASLIGPTGGFLFGFLPLVFFCGFFRDRKKVTSIVLSTVGIAICHLFGVLWFSLISDSPILSSFLLTSAPFLIKDILSAFLAKMLAARIKKHI